MARLPGMVQGVVVQITTEALRRRSELVICVSLRVETFAAPLNHDHDRELHPDLSDW